MKPGDLAKIDFEAHGIRKINMWRDPGGGFGVGPSGLLCLRDVCIVIAVSVKSTSSLSNELLVMAGTTLGWVIEDDLTLAT